MSANSDKNDEVRPTLAAIAVVVRAGQVLLVRRKKEPDAGKWGFPGGHVEPGETALAAAARELAEETSISATPQRYLTNLDIIEHDSAGTLRFHYLLAVVICRYQTGIPVAADDVSDARWFDVSDVCALKTSSDVQEVLSLAIAERH
jgi:mutator protein MutT